MKTLLVTGGIGYIESHTAVEFNNEGFVVVIVDNLSNSQVEVLDGIKQITGARKAAGELVYMPLEYYHFNLLMIVKKYKSSGVMFSSSSIIHGHPNELSFAEKDHLINDFTSCRNTIKNFEYITGVKVNYQLVFGCEGDIEKVLADTSSDNTKLVLKAIAPLGVIHITTGGTCFIDPHVIPVYANSFICNFKSLAS